ncbi:MAG: peptidylprolyl isomerase, partial [Chloroflexota bacterium]|nr:peptidylprolyl isomerase [Chloroflexota bacterium]
SDQVKMIQMIVTGKDTFAKYPNTKYWIQFPEDQKLVNPVSLIDLLNKNILEGEFIANEISGGTSSQHLAVKLESRSLGELLPLLKNTVGTIDLNLWVESDTARVSRILVGGTVVGGPEVKGPNGQDVNIEISIEMSLWDFDKSVAILKPDLPSTPKQLKWDSPPEMNLEDGKDYVAVIKIYGGGEIKIDLLENETPVTVNNFIFLSEQGYYDWVTFHRVIPDFMAQGGDPSGTGRGGPGYFIGNEFHPEARHDSAGVLSMANSGLQSDGQGTNGSQFFITYREAPFLDGLNEDGTSKDCATASCHSVFGRVLEGMDVLNNIVPRDPETASLPGDVIETVEIIAVSK